MKNKIVFILGALLFVNMGYSNVQYCPVSKKDGGYVHNGQLMPKCTENDSPEIWSGSWEDLQVVAKRVEEEFSFETTKHKGRDIASLKPASKQEMEKHISNGNYQEWSAYIFDSYHEPSDTVDDVLMEVLGSYYMSKDVSTGTKEEKRVSAMMKFTNEINKALKFLKNKVVKYTNPDGGEVVYDKETGKIILNSRLGTKNFGKSYEWIGVKIQEYLKTQDWFKYTPQGMSLKVEAAIIREVGKYIPGDHFLLDVVPHEKDNQYKYVGILFESDLDGRFYIIDGQTGKRMTKNQVEDFPTTFSDMWKDKGLVCVESDAIDIVPPKENRPSAQNAPSEVGVGAVKGDIAKTDVNEAKAMGDKCDVIKAIEQLIDCMKERNAAIESLSRSRPKRAMNDVNGIISDGNAISAEGARYAERVEKCIETLNVSFLEMEKEFSNDSTVQINAIREKRYNSIKPHIIELFEILRDSSDKIRHRVENVIPIQLARYLVNCDNRIRKKYYLLPSFGFEH